MLKRLNDNPVFEELYCLVLCVIALLCWCFSSLAGMIIILSVATLSLILLNDFKYMIPCGLFFIFSNSSGYDAAKFPIPVFVCGVLFLVVLIVYMIKNGFHISNLKSGKGIFLLSISCALPILWHNVIPEGEESLYLIYLTYFFYLVIYVIFAVTLKKNSFRILTKTMEYLAILIAFECIIKVIELHQLNPEENILNFWYYIGWGLCNEAGIMMCVCVPFIFIELIKTDKLYKVILSLIRIGIVAVGMLLTTSRGTILFGTIEIFLLFVWSLFFSKKKKTIGLCFTLAICATLISVEVIWGIKDLILDVKNNIFSANLDSNGRVYLWRRATDLWSQDFVRMTFGSGIVAEFWRGMTSSGWKDVYIVYHSTFFECLATMGNLGVAFLIIHFIEKYKQLKKFDKSILGVMLIGYIMVDLYGMIDNTYGMYYYMIPLMILMAQLDQVKKEDISALF